MRVFLAGASGVIGRTLTGLLIEAGHEVTGMTRSPQRAEAIRSLGAAAVVCDALDAQALSAAVLAARPQAVIHELTGPETQFASDGFYGELARKRQLPIIGSGNGHWSFIHVHDAAAATVAALEHGSPGVYNIVDDDPAPARDWIPAFASAMGGKRPLRLPVWIGRAAAGTAGVAGMTTQRAASNAKSKRELGWAPQHASWRDGFRTAAG